MIDESRWEIHMYPGTHSVLREVSGFDQLMRRPRNKSVQTKGLEESLLWHLQESGCASTVVVTNEKTFIMRTVWGEHGGLLTEVMLPSECPYEDLVRAARQWEQALRN